MTMISSPKLCNPLRMLCFLRYTTFSKQQTKKTIEESIKSVVEARDYFQIPDLLSHLNPNKGHNPNPFSFLSSLTLIRKTIIIDEMLQFFIHLKPRALPQTVYSFLLAQTLESSDTLPLALAILQRIIRSGLLPPSQTMLSLSHAWLHRRNRSIAEIKERMLEIGYHLDLSTCNYLLSSLSNVDEEDEAMLILSQMQNLGFFPNAESYGIVISALCKGRRTNEGGKLLRKMVAESGLTPRQGIVKQLSSAMRENGEVWSAVEMLEFLDNNGCMVGFDGYEIVAEGCLERDELLLASKVVMKMINRRFIPYIKLRMKLMERLAGINEWKIAIELRQKLLELGS